MMVEEKPLNYIPFFTQLKNILDYDHKILVQKVETCHLLSIHLNLEDTCTYLAMETGFDFKSMYQRAGPRPCRH